MATETQTAEQDEWMQQRKRIHDRLMRRITERLMPYLQLTQLGSDTLSSAIWSAIDAAHMDDTPPAKWWRSADD